VGLRGFTNPLEAELVSTLVSRYLKWYQDWAVIVPYRAQVKLITELLIASLGDASAVTDNVGTVDSFQGGERDLIVYGFTRSNDRGEVGFLRELRRLNVAITRARSQLVLVGDSATLRSAKDQEFGALMRSLTDYLEHSGDFRRSREVQDRLARIEEGA
jgi:superfamily I DNA and/or RNA helicase